MSDGRENKRVRQACANCRRKKTRCSGERPICAFCARLGQECQYIDDYPLDAAVAISFGPALEENARLAARVALLESRLALLEPSHTDDVSLFDTGSSPAQQSETSNGYASLLDAQTIESLTTVYFLHCHQQPYVYFQEGLFRQCLQDGVLPAYLIWAVAATAVRFSDDPRFSTCQTEVINCYSKMAWNLILQQSFSDAHDLTIWTVQAANMLGTVDFVVGRTQLAWVKIGLAIRFAQTLHMGKEPPASLSKTEAEERRNTFWSVYLLDRLMSCGRDRPPLLLDSDCTIKLPSNPASIRTELGSDIPTLAILQEIPSVAPLEKSDHFALTIFMVSTLGQITRWAFHHSMSESRLPWDSRSEFARIKGILTSFESYSDACDGTFADVLNQHFVSHGVLDDNLASHFTYSHIVYNLNQCLLHHPFLLRQRLRSSKVKVPPGFLRAAVTKSRDHAGQISAILRIIQSRGCKTYPSFFGYAAVIAGIIHRLHSINYQSNKQDEASTHWQSCLRFLNEQSVRWNSFERMCKMIVDFKLTPALAANLLSTSMDRAPLDPEIEDGLWQMCDYSSLTNAAQPRVINTEIPFSSAVSPDVDLRPNLELRKLASSDLTPDFESLYHGAISLDYSLLESSVNDVCTSTTVSQ
ncbi:hypothetical protein ACN47E_007160 [Coniothyrium glycines]